MGLAFVLVACGSTDCPEQESAEESAGAGGNQQWAKWFQTGRYRRLGGCVTDDQGHAYLAGSFVGQLAVEGHV
jgi:hypothetical protein